MFWFSLSLLIDDNEAQRFLYCLINLGLMLLSVRDQILTYHCRDSTGKSDLTRTKSSFPRSATIGGTMEPLQYFLPQIWFFILGLFLFLYVLLDGFDLGVGIL